MERIFEDEFTDLQADYISLCLEFTEKKVDEIYVYIYRNEGMRMFNAFFTKNGKFVSTNEGFPEFESYRRGGASLIRKCIRP